MKREHNKHDRKSSREDELEREKRRARLNRQRKELEAELDDETHELLIRAGEGGTY